MKRSALLTVAAACLAILLGAVTQHLWRQRAPAMSEAWVAPVATPPGITMQLASADKPAGLGAPPIVFADARGMTLYSYSRDTAGSGAAPAVSACSGDCARIFRPALAASDAQGATDWSVLRRADGSRQWCYRGAPLYSFSADEAPGDIKGQASAGGTWHAAAFLPDAGLKLPDSISARHLPDAGGTALTRIDGLTLYGSDDSSPPAATACAAGSACARRWRPFEAGAIANPVGEFTVMARADGITQWAFRGRPLYLFEGDRKPGEARGSGVNERLRVALIRRYFMPQDATIRPITGLGTALVARDGATLYERDRVQPGEDNHDFRSDHGPPALGRFYGTSTCDSGCARTWPPYLAPPGAVASGYWDVLTRADGTRQWAYKGFALYRYSSDAPGEARGNQSYEMVRIEDAGPAADAASETHPPLQLSAPQEAAYVKYVAHGNAAGIGVGALFWHAVAP